MVLRTFLGSLVFILTIITLLSFKYSCVCFCFEGKHFEDFSRATAAFLVISCLAILVTAILISLFGLVDKLRTRTVRLVILVLSTIIASMTKSAVDVHGFYFGLFLYIFIFVLQTCVCCSASVSGRGYWIHAWARIEMFGAGLWIDLVADLSVLSLSY